MNTEVTIETNSTRLGELAEETYFFYDGNEGFMFVVVDTKKGDFNFNTIPSDKIMVFCLENNRVNFHSRNSLVIPCQQVGKTLFTTNLVK